MKTAVMFSVGMSVLSLFGGVLEHSENVVLKDGKASICEGRTLFEDDLAVKIPENWVSFYIYGDHLKAEYRTFKGSQAVVYTHNRPEQGGKIPTAHELISKKIPLPANTGKFRLEFALCSSILMENAMGQTNSPRYSNRVLFYDREEREIHDTGRLICHSAAEIYVKNSMEGEVPRGAAYAVICLGVNNPRLKADDYVAWKDVRFSVSAGMPYYKKTAYLVTSPVSFAGRRLTVRGDIPEKTSLGLQVSLAEDEQGQPGKWGEFCGPAGKDSVYHIGKSSTEIELVNPLPDTGWIRCKVIFLSDGNSTPSLHEIQFDSGRISGWRNYNDFSFPEIQRISKSPTEDAMAPLEFTITDESGVDWKKLTLRLDGKDILAGTRRKGSLLTCFPSAPLAHGIHEVEIGAVDFYGNAVSEKWLCKIGKSPEKRIALRDDGMTLIDGKPFFPIGIFGGIRMPLHQMSFQEMFRQFHLAGINLTTGPYRVRRFHMKEYTEEAEKYGIKLFMPCSIIGTADKDIMRVGRSVLEAIGNPSVIAWYIADDTVNHSTATELKVRNNAVKAVDPSRLTVHADGVSIVTHKISRLPYMNHADIFMPEIYPVYGNEKDVHCVAQVYADMETARREISSVATGRKGIWAIIQYFKGEKWARYPSPLQLRAMSYAALVAGAQGLIWYTYPDLIRTPKRTIFGAAHSAENWKIMTDVSKEISALGEVLAEYTEKTPVLTVISGPSRDSLGNSSVRCIMKKHKNQNYLIAVNSTLEDVAASFEVPDCKEGTVLHEDRRITMQNGKFTDKFGPYGVHVYLLK